MLLSKAAATVVLPTYLALLLLLLTTTTQYGDGRAGLLLLPVAEASWVVAPLLDSTRSCTQRICCDGSIDNNSNNVLLQERQQRCLRCHSQTQNSRRTAAILRGKDQKRKNPISLSSTSTCSAEEEEDNDHPDDDDGSSDDVLPPRQESLIITANRRTRSTVVLLRRGFLAMMLSSSMIVGCSPPPLLFSSSTTGTAMNVVASASTLEEDLISSGQLQPPTTNQPQIRFPTTSSSSSKQQQPLTVEGLVYLKNPRSERRPTASDILVLSVRRVGTAAASSSSENDDASSSSPIAGAKIPVSRIGSFPFRFVMTQSNALVRLETWNDVLAKYDVRVQAIVCDRDAVITESTAKSSSTSSSSSQDLDRLVDQCRRQHAESSPPISGEGIGKLVRLQQSNTDDDDSTTNKAVIRAPVSVPLE